MVPARERDAARWVRSAAVTLAETLHATAQRLPEQPALLVAVDGQTTRTITYRELDVGVRRDAAALGALGLSPGVTPGATLGSRAAAGDLEQAAGDRVAILCPNGAPFVAALYAVWGAGLVAVPVHAGSVAREVAAVAADAGARAVVVHRDLAHVIAAVREQTPALEHVLVVDEATPLAAAAGVDPDPVEALPRDDEQLALVQYTAGTTGEPKGAMLRHRHLVANHRQLAATELAVTERDRVLCVLPTSHIYALNVALAYPLAHGAAVVLCDRFDAAATLALVAEAGVTILVGAPPMFAMWADVDAADELDLAHVRFAVSGAAPLPPSVLERAADRLGLSVYEGYGLTESAPVLTSTAVTGEVRPGSVGHPLPEVALRLIGDDGQPVRRGDPGEVHARGPNIFAGYWHNPNATAWALTDGWLVTGDVGYEQDGALHLVDRKRDLVIVSGFNVYPREVENVLASHPQVAAAAVVGVPHGTTGEAVKAFVQPVPGATPTAEELTAHCAAQLARFKIPAHITIVDELPVGPTGKVVRRRLPRE